MLPMTNTDGQRSCPPSPAFGEPSDVLLPTISSPIDVLPAKISRKRKHADFREDGAQIGPPFTLQAHPSLPPPRAQQLVPRILIPRSCLPLAYLDPVGDQEDEFGSRLLSAWIEGLEGNQQENQLSIQPTVLIAQSTSDGRLHALEKVEIGIYALCRLGQWVTTGAVERLQAGAMNRYPSQMVQNEEQVRGSSDEWWRSAAIKLDSEARNGVTRSGKIPGVRLCLPKSVQKSTPPSPTTDRISASILPEQDEGLLENMVKKAAKEPEEMLNTIKSQYQEALYASKTSLAYFAKGPLSRARAAFHTSDGSGYDQSRLIEFLRTSILSLTTMDTKYRETVPSVVKDLPFGPLSEDESAIVTTNLGKKVRRSKKTKIGKNGLYPGEEVSITRWWLGRDEPSATCDSADARQDATKAVLLEQRARETQMQIILTLEVLALEASSIAPSIEQNAKECLVQGDEESRKKKKKPKKPQDLHTFLDLLVDRLCIWQSMSMDEDKTSSKEERQSSQHAAKAVDKTTTNNHLRQFCVDVVLPFYAARLPDLTALLCQKLGGLKQPSPKRPTSMKAATSQASQKPGTAVQRVQARKPRHTLERVLTDERSASQKPPLSLSRSATDPALPRMKREVSDVSLSSIPLNRVAMHKRYSQREVDLHAAFQATDAKLKKKAKIDQELRSAIATLKKPNPRMAVKELLEDAEKRVAGSHSRKSKYPVRNPFAQGVQVMATPSKNRQWNPFGGLPRLPQLNASAPPEELEDIPPSSVSRVPSSTRRALSTLVKSSARRFGDRLLPSVEQTPTRGPSKFLGRPAASSAVMASTAEIPQSSPAGPESKPPNVPSGLSASYRSSTWNTNIHETPIKDRAIYHVDQAEEPDIEATPIKVPPNDKSPKDALQADPPSQQQEPEISIYASLGWDDDVDELS